MDLVFIIVIILYVVAGVFAFKILKSVVKALLLVGFVGLILVSLLSFFIYKDVSDLKENWPVSYKLLLVEKDGRLLAGFVSSLSGFEEEPLFVNADELAILQSSFNDEDFGSMLGDNYKLFVMDLDSVLVEVRAEQLSLGDLTITKSDVVSILESDNAFSVLVDRLMVDKNYAVRDRAQIEAEVVKSAGSVEKVKAMAFAVLMSELFSEKGSETGVFVLKQFKSGDLVVYPETVVFKTLKFVPDFVIDYAAGFAKKNTGEVV